jgi:hypothetical protein
MTHKLEIKIMNLLSLLLLLALPMMVTAQFNDSNNPDATAGYTEPHTAVVIPNVRVWTMPADEPASRDFKVTADGQPVFVCVTRVAPADEQRRWKAMDDAAHPSDYFDLASFASFDMRSPVKVIRVTYHDEAKQAKILPSSYGIIPHIDGRNVTFPLDHPANLTIEINGDTTSSLHLFANPWETKIADVNDTNTIYFGPGIHEVTNTIKVASGQTLYLAGGAVLRGVGSNGPVVEMKGSHVALRGRGIIDGSQCPRHTRNLLYIQDADDVTVEGVILRDSSTWNVPIRRCHAVTLANVKVFGCRANSDGFDICNSTDVTVDGCFLRTLDDLIVIKSDKGQGKVHHVVVQNCVLWNQVAHALSIGAELREDVDDVLFTNCDVIHDIGREWTLRIYHCDSATVSNVRFENIRVEESRRLISLWINKAVWSREAERGHIRDVTFRNIQAVTTNPPRVELLGFDAGHDIEGVDFDHVVINARPLASGDITTNDFVRQITVKP